MRFLFVFIAILFFAAPAYASCPNIGDLCADGSYYIGEVGGNDIYATSAASESNESWDDGTFEDDPADSDTDGETNTANLVADQPPAHDAAAYCAGLTNVHGHSDWYLPAKDELNLFWNSGSPVAGIVVDGTYYWSSTDSSPQRANVQRFSDGGQSNGVMGTKNLSRLVRCVRRVPAITSDCTDPDRNEGALVYNFDYHAYQYCDGVDWVAIGKGTPTYADTTPDAFGFTDQTDVAVSTPVQSNIVNITGITDGTAVSITGDGTPQFRINGGSWVTSGTINDGDTLQLQLTSNASFSTMNSATVSVGSSSDQWDVTTESDPSCPGTPAPGNEGCLMPDGTIYVGVSPDGSVSMYTTPADAPSAYTWNDGTANFTDTAMLDCTTASSPGVQSSCQTGEANTALLAALSGTGSPAPYAAAEYCNGLSAHGHNDWYLPALDELNVLYSYKNAGDLNGTFDESGSFPAGYYWSSSENGANNARDQRFSDGYQGTSYAKLESFAVRCVRKEGDLTPTAFNFTDQTDVAVSTLTTSNSVTINGIAGGVLVSVSGDGSPEIRVNGGSWAAGPTTIWNGQSLEVRLTSNASGSTMNSATVTVGTVSDQWDVTTQDATPNAFSFTDLTDVPLSKLTTSNSVTINGITGSVSVAVSGDGSPEVRVNGGAWTAGPTTITNGQSLEVRLTTANTDTTMRSATVTVGTANDQWDLTTNDNTPNAFSFTDQTGVAVSTLTTSNSVNITGITGWVDVSVSGDGSPLIRVNGGGWAPSNAITNGQTLEVRLTSNAANSTMNSATVTVGTVSDQWDVTTVAPCAGASVGGYCWYAGTGGQSCDTVCAAQGLSCDLTGTRDYAGSGGTDLNCKNVLDAISLGGGAVSPVSGFAVGCSRYVPFVAVLARFTDPTTCVASDATASRACACN